MYLVLTYSEGEQNRLIQDHLDMVPKLASDYRGRKNIPFEDLVAEGTRALVQAARAFQGRAKFSTYATEWIRGEIKKFIDGWEELDSLDALRAEADDRIYEWQLFMLRVLQEKWTRLPVDPEAIRGGYEEISGKLEAMNKAFLSLDKRERRMVEAHFLDKPRKTLDQIARDQKVSYRHTLRIVSGAIEKMSSIIQKIEQRENSGKVAA